LKRSKPKADRPTRKRFEDYDPEVLERLPYWVREMLKMLDEVEDEKSKVEG
jgi:hypothetical protein